MKTFRSPRAGSYTTCAYRRTSTPRPSFARPTAAASHASGGHAPSLGHLTHEAHSINRMARLCGIHEELPVPSIGALINKLRNTGNENY